MGAGSLSSSEPLKVFSKMEPSTLLVVLFSPKHVTTRVDLNASTEILQVASIPLLIGTRVKPHKHNLVARETLGTNEAWVVMRGSIKMEIFDLDDKSLGNWLLEQGAIAVSLKGGHGLTSLQSDTLVYEFKNGPYWGPDVDKVQIQH